MHLVINGKPKKGLLIDHVNHNGLDNRKENLREATKSQNAQNSRSNRDTSSDYKGPSWYKGKKTDKWQVKIEKNQKKLHVGYFHCEHEAALAYNNKALKLFGDFTHANKAEAKDFYTCIHEAALATDDTRAAKPFGKCPHLNKAEIQ